MKYLCLAYYDEIKFNALPKPELDALVAECKSHDEELHNTGQLMLVASLASSSSSASLRPKQGKPTITDGPFAETKEQLGAFFIIEARDLNDAIRVASKHPAASLGEQVGWGIEVRPIEFFEQP
ncbi:MAG TPA: YciI family protein [Gammaproteobacteria bacterium]